MKNAEIRELSTKELIELVNEKKIEHYKLRAAHAIGNLEKTHTLKSTKRLIAKILTELTQRQKQAQKTEQQQNS